MKLTIVAVLVALSVCAFASTGSAHEGNIWFATAKVTEGNIKDKYFIGYASCFGNARFGHKWVKGFTTRWDHFACLVESDITSRPCAVLAHITGSKWNSLVLTGYKTGNSEYPTCTPRDLRQR